MQFFPDTGSVPIDLALGLLNWPLCSKQVKIVKKHERNSSTFQGSFVQQICTAWLDSFKNISMFTFHLALCIPK